MTAEFGRTAVDGTGAATRGTWRGSWHAGGGRVLLRHHNAGGHRARGALLHARAHARRLLDLAMSQS